MIKSWGSQKRGSRSRSSMGRNDLWIYCDYKPWLLQHLEDHPADRNWVISCYDHMTTTRLLIHMYNVYIYIYIHIYTNIYILHNMWNNTTEWEANRVSNHLQSGKTSK